MGKFLQLKFAYFKNYTYLCSVIKNKKIMVKWYWKCNGCSSIVIHFDNGTIKSVTEQYIKDNNIDLTNAIRLMNSYLCEKCFPMERVCERIMK